MSRDGLDVVVDLGREDIADSLQYVLDIPGANVKALMEQASGKGPNFDRTLEGNKSASNDWRQDLWVAAIGPVR